MANYSWLKSYLKNITKREVPNFSPYLDYRASLPHLIFCLWNLIWLLLFGLLMTYFPGNKILLVVFLSLVILGILFYGLRSSTPNLLHHSDE